MVPPTSSSEAWSPESTADWVVAFFLMVREMNEDIYNCHSKPTDRLPLGRGPRSAGKVGVATGSLNRKKVVSCRSISLSW